jgi:hypothetical protein
LERTRAKQSLSLYILLWAVLLLILVGVILIRTPVL